VTVTRLEDLPAKELHDRAVKLAVRRLDIGFLWDLAKDIPAAEAAAGNVTDAELDVGHMSRLLNDIVHSGEGQIAEALRPVYIQYLREHGSEGA
jgi:hypothetical protein